MPNKTQAPLLQVKNLKVQFPISSGAFFKRTKKYVHAVEDISLELREGKTLAVVGESGSGKTSLGMAIMRLIPVSSGEIILDGDNLLSLNNEELRLKRKMFQIIFQDPYASLNPRQRVGEAVAEPIRRLGMDASQIEPIEEIFSLVGLRPDQMHLFPHQFSGGQRQRIAIARSISTRPKLIVCDEPVSALDVAIQAQILNLLKRLQRKLKLSYIFISHDLSVVRHISDEVIVMYLGKIVERASRLKLFTKPKHPYTHTLLMSSPSMALRKNERQSKKFILKGDPPSPIDLPKGCAFAARCMYAKEHCFKERPLLENVEANHKVACFYPL